MKRKIVSGTVVGALLIAMLAGCSGQEEYEIVPVPKDIYQKMTYETVTVQKGDMVPILTINLTQNAYEQISYSLEISDLKVKEVNVAPGDAVTEGQVLVVFESEELEKELEKKRDEVETKRFLLEHTKNLRAIEDDGTDSKENLDRMAKYDSEGRIGSIPSLEDDIKVAEIFLAEAQKKLDACTVKAKKDGVITYVNQGLKSGVCSQGATILTEASGDLHFYAEVKDDYPINVGDKFTAESASMSCTLMVTKIEGDERSRTLYFDPADIGSTYITDEKFVITITKEQMNDVVYVDEKTINVNKDNKKYVYVLNEDGFRDVVYVESNMIVNGMAIIEDGLEGGEEVVVK